MKQKGFTLIELVVVMAIIAVLALLVIGAIIVARRTATETTNRSNMKTVQTALEATFAKYKTYCGVTGTPACVAVTDSTTAASFQNGIGNPSLTASCTDGIDTLTTPAGSFYSNKGVYVTSLASTGYILYPASYDCSTNLTGDKIAVQ